MNVRATHVMTTPLVRLAMKVLLTANVMLDILETDLIVLVSKSYIHKFEMLYLF
jgi:hypothetical protein